MKVILISALTICGRISPAVMGSVEDRRILEELRAKTGASLMGAETLRQQNPEMRGPDGSLDVNRIRAVITQSGTIPLSDKKLFSGEEPLPVLFTGENKATQLALQVKDRGTVIALPPGPSGLSIAAAVDKLADMGAETMLIEGGGILNYAALKEQAVDELYLTISPFLSGDTNAALLVDGAEPLGDPFLPLKLQSWRPSASGEIYLKYSVMRT